VYSAGSAPPTSFNSPNAATFPLSRESQSPPRDPNAIRLPPTPLSDLNSPLQQQQQLSQVPSTPHSPPTPRKAHTSPYYTTTPPNSAALVHSSPLQQQQRQGYYRQSLLGDAPEAGWRISPPSTPAGMQLSSSPKGSNALIGVSPAMQSPVPAAA
jgi:hypothetical protein